jgi:diguanylate cyclase (GGDEF)-like protein
MAADRDRWREAWARAEHRSTHDELTGLPGRGILFDRLDHALATTTRRGAAIAVLFIDIDGFKRVNDAHGHAVGDAALTEVAHRLSLTLRANDTLARLSGDEFVIVCEDLAGTIGQVHEWLHRLGERILFELRRPATGQETTIDVSVSIGAAITRAACSPQQLTAQADHAMYAAKRSGGARLVIHRTG